MSKEISQLAQAKAARAIDVLDDVMENAPRDSDRIAAANAILDRGYGKPSQAVIQIPPNKRQAALLAAMDDEELIAIIEQKALPKIGGSQPMVEVITNPRTGEVLDRRRIQPTTLEVNPHGVTDCYVDEEPTVDELLL